MPIQIRTPMDKEPGGRHSMWAHLYYCKNCDSELYSLYYFPITREKVPTYIALKTVGPERSSDGNYYCYKNNPQSISQYNNLPNTYRGLHCPVCDAVIEREYCERLEANDDDYARKRYEHSFSKDKDRILKVCNEGGYYFSDLKQKCRSDLINGAHNQAKKWLNSTIIMPSEQADRTKVKEYGMSVDNIKQYLQQLIRLEMSKSSLGKRIDSLYVKQSEYQMYERREKGLDRLQLNSFRDAINEAQEEYDEAKAEPVYVPMPAAPKKPIEKKPGLFNKNKVLQQNQEMTQKYEEEMRLYEKEVKRCEEESIKLTEKAIADAKRKLENSKRVYSEKQSQVNIGKYAATNALSLIDKEMSEAKALYVDTCTALTNLYDVGIIFEKYHDIVAVSTFYEYIMSGRCSVLEGPDGAYNLYESEIRSNLIISQLSEIIENLQAIKQNQYILYSEMTKMNKTLSALHSQMSSALESLDKIDGNTKQIEYNTAVAAFYAQKNAELTSALGLMVALK